MCLVCTAVFKKCPLSSKVECDDLFDNDGDDDGDMMMVVIELNTLVPVVRCDMIRKVIHRL